MKLLKPDKELIPYGIRAISMVARASENGLGKHQATLLSAIQKIVLHSDINIDNLADISPEHLVKHFTDPDLSRQLIQGMIVMSIVDNPTTIEQAKLISSFAKALNVAEPAVAVINKLAEKEMLLFRLDFYRNSHLVDYIKSTYHAQGGVLGVAKALLGIKGLIQDKPLAERFHAFGDLPNNTLGYAFYRHYMDNGFAFPGEKKGFPLGAVYHDFGHVLSDNPPTREGEMLNGAFQAGYRQTDNAFYIVLFVVLSHSSGINMIPIKMRESHGRLGEGDLAERVLKELERGAAMNTDLGDNWDFWSYIELPIEKVRSMLAIPEKL